jgi:hypothetical protein
VLKSKSHALNQIVGFGRSVRDVGFVPGSDLVFPTRQRAPETPGFFGQFGVLKIVAESLDEAKGEDGIAVIVGTANEFLRVPSGKDVTLRVTRIEESINFSRPRSG